MTINNFDHIIKSNNYDIIHQEKLEYHEEISKSSELILTIRENNIRIKFDLKKENEINKSDFLFIPETDFLFYRGEIEWCAFDLKSKTVKRNESATQLHFLERKKDVVIIFDELYAESTNLKAEKIDKVPIDPPTESTDFEDRIEFDSPVFGKQILKLKI